MKIGRVSSSEYDRTVIKYTGERYLSRPFSGKREGLSTADYVEIAGKRLRKRKIFQESMAVTCGKCGIMVAERAVMAAACAGVKANQATVFIQAPVRMSEHEIRNVICMAVETLENKGIEISDISVFREDTKRAVINVSVSGERFLKTTIRETEKSECAEERKEKKFFVVMLGAAAAEGAVALREIETERLEKVYSKQFLDDGCLMEELNIGDKLWTRGIDAEYMVPVKDGGVFGALWELGEQLHLGMKIDLKKIFIPPLAVEICETLDISPYTMMGGGAALAVVSDAKSYLRSCEEADIRAVVIGELCQGNNRLIINEDEERYIEPFREDGLMTYLKGIK